MPFLGEPTVIYAFCFGKRANGMLLFVGCFNSSAHILACSQIYAAIARMEWAGNRKNKGVACRIFEKVGKFRPA